MGGPARLAPGTRIDRYEVIELLGEGSMGSVYRARDTDLAREVALKRIRPGRLHVAAAQARLRREARAMAQVEHAAVIRIYDVLVVDGELFVAMELARGGALAAWLRARPRGWREVVRVFVEAGRGLAAAHQVGLVHRDIKPSNLLLDGNGRAKVGDFGLARMFGTGEGSQDDEAVPADDLDATITRTGAIAGTLAYMAPEQLSGGPIDGRADQFAFCVALWEALCGRRPFCIVEDSVRTPGAFLGPIVAGSVAGPASDVQVPRRVLALVRRGLAADRSLRWRSMDELLDALDRAARPRRWWPLAAAGAIGVTVAVIAAVTHSPERPSPVICGRRDQIAAVWNPGLRARYLSGAASGDPALEDAGWFDWYARGLEAAYATSCGQGNAQQIACLDDAIEDLRAAIVRTPRTYWPRLRALDRCATTWSELDLGNLGANELVRLSADKRQLLGWTFDDRPTVRDLGSSRRRPFDLAEPLKWLRDGSIAGQDEHGRIAFVDPSTDRTLRVFEARGKLIDVSPDLRRVAVIAEGKLSIVPIAGGAAVVAPIPVAAQQWVAGSFSPDDRRFAAAYDGRLYIDDLDSQHRETIAFRTHHHGVGSTTLRWLDPTSVLMSGSATIDLADDVWRVRMDAAGRLAEPPQILQRSERDAVLRIDDVQAGSMLIERLALASQNLMLTGASSRLLPGSASRLRPLAADRSHQRVLAAANASGTSWAWVSLDGLSAQPIAGLEGLRYAATSRSGLAALDLRGQPAIYVEFDEAGTELGRVAIEAARGAEPMLRCGASSCLVKWVVDGAVFTAQVAGSPPAVGAALRHDRAELASSQLPWELSPDGTQIAVASNAEAGNFMLYDVEHRLPHYMTGEKCQPQHIWFSPDGALIISGFSPHLVSSINYILVRRDATGERVLWSGDAWISGVTLLDDSRMIVSTRSFQARIGLLENR